MGQPIAIHIMFNSVERPIYQWISALADIIGSKQVHTGDQLGQVKTDKLGSNPQLRLMWRRGAVGFERHTLQTTYASLYLKGILVFSFLTFVKFLSIQYQTDLPCQRYATFMPLYKCITFFTITTNKWDGYL